MQDFIRIGGAITSSPLNENFRRLLNAISISNTNLIFPEENAVVDTLDDMLAIQDPLDAQTCYVISSGELYRYSKAGNGEWVKIADFGQTFRQGFLNSGAVVLERPIELVANSKTVLQMPNMLVYFKNQPGDNRYLKGMYLIEKKQFNIETLTGGANAYSIVVNVRGEYSLIIGLPKEDDPNNIYLGTVLINTKNEIIPEFVFTLPDIAYTADRGQFLMNGGQASGCNLIPHAGKNKRVNRKDGYYYDEGINVTYGLTDDFPIDTDNGSNWNLKYYEAEDPVDVIYYMTPQNPLDHTIYEKTELDPTLYWDGLDLKEVPEGYYTIQHHLVTPNGQDVILYGSTLYNSVTDAVSNINSVYGFDIDFPYMEATRIVVSNLAELDTADENRCKFFTMGRLSQVGTISPRFADNAFLLYSGDGNDLTPSTMRFSLEKLQEEQFSDLYTLKPLPHAVTRQLFGLDTIYITDDETKSGIKTTSSEYRGDNGSAGYVIADHVDVLDIQKRVKDLELEVWSLYDDEKERCEQSIRYRLFNAEIRLDDHDDTLEDHETRIKWMEDNKVYKGTKINDYVLGDSTDKDEVQVIELVTGDIHEGVGNDGTPAYRWFTEQRVRDTDWVDEAHTHYTTLSTGEIDGELSKTSVEGHTQINPHNLTTDDIQLLSSTDKLFVTVAEERRIRADKLPDDTIKALADLDAKNMDSIHISQLEGNSEEPGTGAITDIGDVQNIRFYEDGAILNLTDDGNTLVVECKGQIDEDKVMLRTTFATAQYNDPTNPELEGYVDKAITANTAQHISGLAEAGASKYYGTDDNGKLGIHDIKRFVTTDYWGDTAQDSVYLVPTEKSIEIDHLVPELQDQINNNYHLVLDSGEERSNEVNTFNFGNSLEVSVMNNVATINVREGTQVATENKFVNLDDVSVTYTNNAGRMLVVNEEENGIVLSTVPSLHDCMLKVTYVDETDGTKVKKAVEADHATLATTATNALAVNNKVVDNSANTSGVLWTADKIITNTTSQIQNEGVNTYSGTSAPSDSLGKNGDIYVLIGS